MDDQNLPAAGSAGKSVYSRLFLARLAPAADQQVIDALYRVMHERRPAEEFPGLGKSGFMQWYMGTLASVVGIDAEEMQRRYDAANGELMFYFAPLDVLEPPPELLDEAGATMEDVRAENEEARRQLEQQSAAMNRWRQRLADAGQTDDLFIDLELMVDEETDEGDRRAAMQRLFDRLNGLIVHRKRYSSVADELDYMEMSIEEYAKAHIPSASWETALRTLDKLPMSIMEMFDYVIEPNGPDYRKYVNRLRNRLTNLICNSLFGPGWRSRARAVPLTDGIQGAGMVEGDIEASEEWGWTLRQAGLSLGEREAVDLKVQGFDDREIARRLNTTWGAVRERLRVARAKIDAALNPS